MMPKDSFQTGLQGNIVEGWRQLIHNLEKSLDLLDKGLNEAAEMVDICTDEWCMATEHVIDELGNALYSISEPKWAPEQDSMKLRSLRKRLHDLYARYKAVSKK